ncbi:MAG: hypothetical protein WCT31_02055 [Candidatus Micrarchaeia archaeon]
MHLSRTSHRNPGESTPTITRDTSWARFKDRTREFYTRREREIGMAFLLVAFAAAAARCGGPGKEEPAVIDNGIIAAETAEPEANAMLKPPEDDPQLKAMAVGIRTMRVKRLDPKKVVAVRNGSDSARMGITLEELYAATEGQRNFKTYELNRNGNQMKKLVAAMRILDRTIALDQAGHPIAGAKNWGEFVRKSIRQVWFNPEQDFCGRYSGLTVKDNEKTELGDGRALIAKTDTLGRGRFAMVCPDADAYNMALTLVHEARHWQPIIVPKEVANDPEALRAWDESIATATEGLFRKNHRDAANSWMKKQAENAH